MATALQTAPFGHAGVFMPLWDDLRETMDMCPAWEYGVRVYCDLTTHDTVAMWEGPDGFTDAAGDYDWCGYVWHEDGTCEELDTSDGLLWWCLDDLLWGAFEDSTLALVDRETGHLRTREEVMDLMRLRGCRFLGDEAMPELDLTDEEWDRVRDAMTPEWERAPRRPTEEM